MKDSDQSGAARALQPPQDRREPEGDAPAVIAVVHIVQDDRIVMVRFDTAREIQST